jgi:hypothetical protein
MAHSVQIIGGGKRTVSHRLEQVGSIRPEDTLRGSNKLGTNILGESSQQPESPTVIVERKRLIPALLHPLQPLLGGLFVIELMSDAETGVSGKDSGEMCGIIRQTNVPDHAVQQHLSPPPDFYLRK